MAISEHESKRHYIIIYKITILIMISLFQQSNAFKNFGMNKPHYLFHLGDRRPVSVNLGWGYWSGQNNLRLKYQNTKDQLYASMNIHDGQTIFQQEIQDTKSKINSLIKYQLKQNSWETQIKMKNQGDHQMTWFTYFSVQNNDYKLVDHEKLTSYIYLIPQYKKSKNQININSNSFMYQNQTISIIHQKDGQKQQDKEDIKIFGLAANISQTYSINQISQTFKHLVRVNKGQQQIQSKDNKQLSERDKKIIEWEKKQVQFMRQDKWERKSYVIVYVYGTLQKGQQSTIFLTNATTKSKSFDHTSFQQKFAKLKQLYQRNIEDEDKKQFVRHVISNLYGGMTFYYGRLYTQNSLTVHKQDYSFSFTPSRLIFPRSFLWDDGFHQSVIANYNPSIVIEVLSNWMNKIDIFGWIGRQQIRGSEISTMMPDSRFIFQDWFEMNPPTLMVSLIQIINKSKQDSSLKNKLQIFLLNYYRKMQSWYRYFKNTQSHQSLQYQDSINSTDRFFRWHCKDQCSKGNFMGSGLDDYPRRDDQNTIAKQHVDLVSWLYLFSNSLSQIGKYMQENNILYNNKTNNKNIFGKKIKFYDQQSHKYLHQLFNNFYDSSDSLFKDVVVAKNDLFIQKFVNKIGYINLFPFFTGMLTEDHFHSQSTKKFSQNRIKSLEKCLSIMRDQKLLFSQDGLRSLSLSDPLYGTDDNYWRGAVWLPINYMVLRACKIYYWNDAQVGNQIKQFYQSLRLKLINSVFNTYKNTGYLYQNYYEGKGHRGYPFYGWTATIANIITQKY